MSPHNPALTGHLAFSCQLRETPSPRDLVLGTRQAPVSPLLSPVHCPGPVATIQAVHGTPKPLPKCDLQYQTRVFMMLRN